MILRGRWLAILALVGCNTPADPRAPAPTAPAAPAAHPQPPPPPPSCKETGCPDDQFCDYAPDLCGFGSAPGVCRPRPTTCDAIVDPVCACDHKVYPSECAARLAGADLAALGGCGDHIPERIACGPRYCDAQSSYCEIVLSDVIDLPSDSRCRSLPDACAGERISAKSGCKCFPAGTRCADFCAPVETGSLVGYRLTCVGGR